MVLRLCTKNYMSCTLIKQIMMKLKCPLAFYFYPVCEAVGQMDQSWSITASAVDLIRVCVKAVFQMKSFFLEMPPANCD